MKKRSGQEISTAQLISLDKLFARVTIISLENVVVCGIPCFEIIYQKIDSEVKINWNLNEGDFIASDHQLLAGLTRKACLIFTGERTALNSLQSLSGTVTLVHIKKINLLSNIAVIFIDEEFYSLFKL